ncbi:Signal transduction histidine kinase [Micrococcales bacterium KH10]|nr:Signal transduction histidine kinase [Micrococcales bacterium KH10]
MLRRLSVRGKILATLAVPIVVLIAAAAIIAVQSVTTALVGRESQLLAESTPAHDILMSALQEEYTLTLQIANGADVSDVMLESRRANTDRALKVYNEQTSQIDFGRFSATVETAWANARAGLRGLDRDLLDASLVDKDEINAEPMVVAVYSSVIRSQEDFYNVVTDAMSDRHVAAYFSLYANTFQLRAAYSNEVRVVGNIVENRATASPDDPTVRNAMSAIQNTDLLISQTVNALADLEIREIPITDMATQHRALRAVILANRPNAITTEQADAWTADTTFFENQVAIFQGGIRNRLVDTVTAAANEARTQAIVTASIALASVILSLLLALLIARRIVVPLSRLTAAATKVRDELPTLVEQVAVPGVAPTMTIDPIEVKSKDEIGQLATVLNDMNETTIEVAQEQAALRGSIAEMFVNVARRDHTLLNRQLSFLDELERAEEDPTVLSNLFRLDHLATRMRRNSESLLVLAGIDSGRRVREPMALSDVVRTASSEIEAYDRVSLTLLQDPMMLGHNALHAAHLLAELLENATMFSDPSEQVEVTTNADQDYVSVAIRDFGLGMTQEEIAEANLKVSSRSATDVVGAQRLGLLVVGRLAERLEAHVNFEAAPDGGTLVIVAFPAKLFAATAADVQEPIEPLAPVQRSAAEIQDSEEWVPPAPVQEVDLASLTDGMTATGMPRRRGAGDGDAPAEPAPITSAAPVGGTMTGPDYDENAIVLPEIAAPDVSAIGVTPDAEASDWQPLQQASFEPGGLPSRGAGLPTRGTATGSTPVVEEPFEETPIVNTERRASMFSQFRASSDLAEVAGSADQTGAAPVEDPARYEPTIAEPEPTGHESAGLPDRAAVFSQFRTSSDLPLEQPAAAPSAPSAEPEWTPQLGESAPAESAPVAEEVQPGTSEPATEVPAFEQPEASDPAVADFPQQVAAVAETGVDGAAPSEHKIVLPRHASPEDLERLMREYGGPEGVSAAITGPIPAVPESSVVPEQSAHVEESAPEPAIHDTDALVSDDSVRPDDNSVQPDLQFAEDQQAYAPAADFSESADLAQPTWDNSEQASYGAVPMLEPDEPESFEQPQADYAEQFPADPQPEPAPYEAAGTDANGYAAQDAPQPQIAEQYAQQAEAAPAQPYAPQTPTPPPSFGDVVAGSPTDDGAAKEAKPEKRGIFGKLFGKKKSAEEQPAADSAPADAGTAGQAWSSPTAPPTGYRPDGTQSPPAQPETPAPTAYEPPSVTPAPQPVAESSWSADGAEASQPAASASSQDFDSGFPHFGGQGSFTPKPAGAQQNEWSPDAFNFDSPDTPRSMSPELAATLASRADLQDQALAELSQLSSYRPQEMTVDGGSGLVKRKKAAPVEAGPAEDDPTKQRITRDAAVLRTRLAAFQSGTSRGREAGVEPGDNSDPSSEGDSH